MSAYKVLIVRENHTFSDDVSSFLAANDANSEVLSIPSAMRALGAVNMLNPTHVLLDIDTPGIENSIDDIAAACEVVGAVLIFDSTVNPQATKELAVRKNALAFDGSNGSYFVEWLLGGCPPLHVASADEKTPVTPANTAPPADQTPPAVAGGEAAPPLAATRPSTSPVEYVPLVSPGTTRSGERLPAIDELLIKMLDAGGSDLHITTGSCPRYRVRGELINVPNTPKLFSDDCARIITQIIEEKRLAEFRETHELDYSYSIPGKSRFRVNVFQQRGGMGCVLRTIPFGIPTIDQLGLPQVCRDLADRPRGLVLVTGPTGSGKSTTLAAMIDYINDNKAVHIMTMEDPIEFMHQNKKALINQREVGEDTASFTSALKRVLRQDPDVILVGEMRDLETIAAAITAAETGHLVFGTLHTIGGPETVDRIIDVFPPEQQSQIRMQLSNSMQGVLSQVLCPTADGKGRILAQEIMLGIPAIGNLIREGKTHQMPSIIQSSGGLGMMTLDQSLRRLANAGKITIDTAIEKSQDPKDMAESLGRPL